MLFLPFFHFFLHFLCSLFFTHQSLSLTVTSFFSVSLPLYLSIPSLFHQRTPNGFWVEESTVIPQVPPISSSLSDRSTRISATNKIIIITTTRGRAINNVGECMLVSIHCNDSHRYHVTTIHYHDRCPYHLPTRISPIINTRTSLTTMTIGAGATLTMMLMMTDDADDD